MKDWAADAVERGEGSTTERKRARRERVKESRHVKETSPVELHEQQLERGEEPGTSISSWAGGAYIFSFIVGNTMEWVRFEY